MTSIQQTPQLESEKGALSSIFQALGNGTGKFLAGVSLASMMVLSLGVMQGMGLDLGTEGSSTYYEPQISASQSAGVQTTFNRIAEVAKENRINFDSDISFDEAMAASLIAGGSAIASNLSYILANGERNNKLMQQKAISLLGDRQEELMDKVATAYSKKPDSLSIPELSMLVMLPDEKIDTLPEALQLKIYTMQRDIGVAYLYKNISRDNADLAMRYRDNPYGMIDGLNRSTAGMNDAEKITQMKSERDLSWKESGFSREYQNITGGVAVPTQMQEFLGKLDAFAHGSGGLLAIGTIFTLGAGLPIVVGLIGTLGPAAFTTMAVRNNFSGDDKNLTTYELPVPSARRHVEAANKTLGAMEPQMKLMLG